jgi:hypothetical protein
MLLIIEEGLGRGFLDCQKAKERGTFFFEAFVGVPGDPVDADSSLRGDLGYLTAAWAISLWDSVLIVEVRRAVDVSAVWAVETLLTDPLAAWDESSEDALRNNSFGM